MMEGDRQVLNARIPSQLCDTVRQRTALDQSLPVEVLMKESPDCPMQPSFEPNGVQGWTSVVDTDEMGLCMPNLRSIMSMTRKS